MRLLRALTFSLILHALLCLCLSLVRPEPPVPAQSSPINGLVEFIDSPPPSPEERKSVVRSQQLPAEMLKTRRPEDHARFLSESDQTVAEEMKARDSGMTTNRSQSVAQQQKKSENAAGKRRLDQRFGIERPQGMPASAAPSDIAIAANEMDQTNDAGNNQGEGKPLQYPDMNPFALDPGHSTLGESLPDDIKFGHFTALNTDRYLYYSFYARAEELIRYRWEKYVKAVLYTYQHSGSATGDELWLTRIEITLDRNGNFVKGLVHQGSGLEGLDLAPVHAFREARQVPHPPPEMVGADGLIHMNYEFSVRMVPGALARGP